MVVNNICHFSRYVSVSVVEDLSTEAIINSIMGHIYRFGRAKVIETDCGTDYKGAQRLLQAEEELASVEWPLIRSKLKSRGIQLVMRGAKMPWITGGAEAANKMLKKMLPPNKKLSLFALNIFLEYAMYNTINSRPIGWSTSDETVSSIDIIPVWSKLDPKTMAGASKCLLDVMDDFIRNGKNYMF